MGVLDMFKKKKTDDFAINPDMQNNWQEPMQNYSPTDNSRDYAFGNQPEPYPQMQQQQHPGFAPQDNSQGFTPEQAGFDRIRERDSFPTRSSQSVSDINIGKDLELINAKLDAIKSELDSVNQRIKRIERISEGGSTNEKKDPWNY